MKLNKLFIGDIYTFNKEKLVYGPYYAPLSLSSTVYNINFKKRTLLYKKTDYTYVDLSIKNNKTEIKSSDNISDVKMNEDFVMVDDNLISIEKLLLEKNIKRKFTSKKRVKKLMEN